MVGLPVSLVLLLQIIGVDAAGQQHLVHVVVLCTRGVLLQPCP